MMVAETTEQSAMLLAFKAEVEEELEAILSWWMNTMQDEKHGGFHGSVNNENIPRVSSPRGIVLNSRILWTFSAAYQFTRKAEYLQLATRAFDYISKHFIDREYGGVYWSVDQQGRILDGKKQVYGQAFCIYGMVEYYKISKNDIAMGFAKELFHHIERYSLDKEKGGYIEAFSREWNPVDDLRLSDKDENEKKTMNTHLHVIEAYASLYTVWPDQGLKEKIAALLELFDRYIINKSNHHLNLFMDMNWALCSSLISFGHDIEAAWLLLDCAQTTGHESYVNHYKPLSVALADAAAEGLDNKGGLWYEYEPAKAHWVKEKHSWPQAEAMVGFFSAWQLTGNKKYLHFSKDCWDFIKKKLKDPDNGEWYWGIAEDGSLMQKEKAGFWKCPYHSSRACMEISKRISTLV